MANRNFEVIINDSLDMYNTIDDVEIDEKSLQEMLSNSGHPSQLPAG